MRRAAKKARRRWRRSVAPGRVGRRSASPSASREWRERARRFGESTDHWNTRSWSGSVDPSLVNLKNSWALGQKRAITALRKCGVNYAGDALAITRLIRKNPRLSSLNWDGKADAAAAAADDDA